MVNIKNNKGNSFIWFMMLILIFLAVAIVLLDYGNLYINTKRVKTGMNLAVKAGTLAIKENENLADGKFEIDETQALINFKNILSENLGLNKTTLEPLKTGSLVTEKPKIKEFEIINQRTITYYSNTLKYTYKIENPSVLSVIEVKIKGIFSTRVITINKLASSQLTSTYD